MRSMSARRLFRWSWFSSVRSRCLPDSASSELRRVERSPAVGVMDGSRSRYRLTTTPFVARKPARSRSASQLTVAAMSPGSASASFLRRRAIVVTAYSPASGGKHDRARHPVGGGARRDAARGGGADARRRAPVPRVAPEPAVRPRGAGVEPRRGRDRLPARRRARRAAERRARRGSLRLHPRRSVSQLRGAHGQRGMAARTRRDSRGARAVPDVRRDAMGQVPPAADLGASRRARPRRRPPARPGALGAAPAVGRGGAPRRPAVPLRLSGRLGRPSRGISFNKEMSDVRELIIIGGGPAGYTAALYSARANLQPLVIEGFQWGGQLMITSDVENYPGYPDGVMGPAMMADFRRQAEQFGAEYLTDDVTRVDFSEQPFRVWAGDEQYQAKAVIVATGASARQLGLESERALQGRGVTYCATCDGAFYRDLEVVVVGGGDSAMEEALFLTKFASKVTLVHR